MRNKPHSLFLRRIIAKAFREPKTTQAHIVDQESRRKFIKATAISTAGLAFLSSSMLTACKDKIAPRIAIIGAGIAGLTAAFYLKKSGFFAEIYEASNILGGRIQTKSDLLGDGLTTELGGEFIDSNHDDMFSLIDAFGLQVIDVEESDLIKDAFLIDGVVYTEAQVVEEFCKYTDQMALDAQSIPDDTSYKNPEASALDKLSIDKYLKSLGMEGWLLKLITTAYTSEMGIESSQQSCINLLWMIDTELADGKLKMYGDSDERYKIKGGNYKLIEALQIELSEQIKTNHSLEAILKADEEVVLKFKGITEQTFDYAICTVPFSILRDIEIKAGFSEVKLKCIRELGYGTNSKIFLGYNNRPWRESGYAGYLFNDLIHNGWDNTQMQTGNEGHGGYTVYLGGNAGFNAKKEDVNIYLDNLNLVFKGSKANFNGINEVYNWSTNPQVKGSYAAYKTGQLTTIAGAEAEPVGNLFFAGEHCSANFQGFMNGGAETGRAAAENILEKIKVSKPAAIEM